MHKQPRPVTVGTASLGGNCTVMAAGSVQAGHCNPIVTVYFFTPAVIVPLMAVVMDRRTSEGKNGGREEGR